MSGLQVGQLLSGPARRRLGAQLAAQGAVGIDEAIQALGSTLTTSGEVTPTTLALLERPEMVAALACPEPERRAKLSPANDADREACQGKVIFKHRGIAKAAAKRRAVAAGIPIYHYACPVCRLYHLTSKPQEIDDAIGNTD